MKINTTITKITAIVMILVSVLSACTPFHVEAASTYNLNRLTETQYDGGVCTVKYFAPLDYPNVIVLQQGTTNKKYHLAFYRKDTTVTYEGNYTYVFSDTVHYVSGLTLAQIKTLLFEGGNADTNEVTEITNIRLLTIYTKDKIGTQDMTIDAKSLESIYYDYYYEKNGEYPTFTGQGGENGDIGGDDTGNEDDGENGDIGGDDTGNEDDEENNEDEKGFWERLTSTLEDIVKLFTFQGQTDFIQKLEVKLAEKLEDNKFYTSIRYIERTLTDLYSQDYTDPEGFKNLSSKYFNTKLNIRVPTNEYAFNFGNDVIGDWYQPYEYQTGRIDWGLENVETMPMEWFFGKKITTAGNGTPGYSKGVKSITDPIISAFLWFSFAFTLWHRLPEIVSGELATIAGFGGDVIRADIEEQRSIEKALEIEERNALRAEEKAQREATRQAEKEHRKSYEYYKENRDRNAEFNARYWNEKRGKK